MNPETNRESHSSGRALNVLKLASVGLLALTTFALVKLGFAAVPVWILAVPFVLLGVLDVERCLALAGSFARRVAVAAFHFVIVATVVAAHQQIGGGRATGMASAGGCGSGGCGSGGCGSAAGQSSGAGGCGGGCGGTARLLPSSATGASKGASGCGCGSGKTATTAKTSTTGTIGAAAQRAQSGKPAGTVTVHRATAPRAIGTERLPMPAPLGPKLGAGMPGVTPRDAASAPGGAVVPLPARDSAGQQPAIKPATPAASTQRVETGTPAPIAAPPPPPPAAPPATAPKQNE